MCTQNSSTNYIAAPALQPPAPIYQVIIRIPFCNLNTAMDSGLL